MLRRWLPLALSFYGAACAQIAGFEQLTPKKQLNEAGTGGFAGAISAGPTAGDGGAPDGAGEGGNVNEAGGNVNIGNNAGATSTAGTTSTAGMGGSAGSGAGAGNAGSGGVEVVGGCDAEQLKNAFFDRGPVDWTTESTAPGILGVDDVILERNSLRLTEVQVEPQSGDYLAWFGNEPNSDINTRVNLMQEVDIPDRISRLVVSGRIRIRTDEPVVAEANDWLDIALQDEDDFWAFHTWYVDAADEEWQAFEYAADNPAVLDAVRGRTVTFIIESKTDTSSRTDFWVDSLSFIAECP
jgi:hypothetical protein